MAYEFRFLRRVEFSETDMAGLMHFSNFFRFMESAEHAFFRSLGFSIHPQGEGESIGWPRIHAACDYRSPLHFEDEVEIHLLVREKREKGLSYDFIFRKLNGERPVEVARGTISVACVRRDPKTGRMRSVVIPTAIARKIEVAPVEVA